MSRRASGTTTRAAGYATAADTTQFFIHAGQKSGVSPMLNNSIAADMSKLILTAMSSVINRSAPLALIVIVYILESYYSSRSAVGLIGVHHDQLCGLHRLELEVFASNEVAISDCFAVDVSRSARDVCEEGSVDRNFFAG